MNRVRRKCTFRVFRERKGNGRSQLGGASSHSGARMARSFTTSVAIDLSPWTSIRTHPLLNQGQPERYLHYSWRHAAVGVTKLPRMGSVFLRTYHFDLR